MKEPSLLQLAFNDPEFMREVRLREKALAKLLLASIFWAAIYGIMSTAVDNREFWATLANVLTGFVIGFSATDFNRTIHFTEAIVVPAFEEARDVDDRH